MSIASDIDNALTIACDRLGQYGGCPKCDRYNADDSFIENCAWVSEMDGRRYCSYAKCWRKHLMELSLRSSDKQ